MKYLHQSGQHQTLAGTPRHWRLGNVQQVRARCAGRLQVSGGRVWITRPGDATDHVLDAGDGLWLERREQVLVEPWRAGHTVVLRWAVGAGVAAWAQDLPADLAARLATGLAPASPGRLAGVLAPVPGLARSVLALGLRGAAGFLAAAARSADAMANRAQGNICGGDSIASSGAVQ